ncbi:MAG: hypothetical protein ACTSR8_17560 [Promethearchaeota archaeon]
MYIFITLTSAYYTGVPYGNVDINRICNFVNLLEDKICFSEKAQNALEDFLFSRYQMYKIVYIHKTVIFYNLLLQKIYQCFFENNLDLIPFSIPNFKEITNADEKWFNEVYYNITESRFFESINILLDSERLTGEEKENLKNLYDCIKYRKPVKNCFRIDDLPEQTKTEYCDIENEVFFKLKEYPEIINHWSFLRHDPSKPLRITSPIKGNIDDTQDPEQIRIYSKQASGNTIDLLQAKSNSYIGSLAKHHRVLICYYHSEPKSQKIIKDLAHQYFPES